MRLVVVRDAFEGVEDDETTADFVKWIFEHGKFIAQVSSVARYKDADYVRTARQAGAASASGAWADHNAAAMTR